MPKRTTPGSSNQRSRRFARRTHTSSASQSRPRLPSIGDAVDIWWEDRDTAFRGTLASRVGKRRHSFLVSYDDGDKIVTDLNEMFWRFARSGHTFNAQTTSMETSKVIDDTSMWFEPGDVNSLILEEDDASFSAHTGCVRGKVGRRSKRRKVDAFEHGDHVPCVTPKLSMYVHNTQSTSRVPCATQATGNANVDASVNINVGGVLSGTGSDGQPGPSGSLAPQEVAATPSRGRWTPNSAPLQSPVPNNAGTRYMKSAFFKLDIAQVERVAKKHGDVELESPRDVSGAVNAFQAHVNANVEENVDATSSEVRRKYLEEWRLLRGSNLPYRKRHNALHLVNIP